MLAGVYSSDGTDTSDNGRHPAYMGIANSDVSFFMSPLSRVLIGLIPHLMDARPSCISVERAALYRGAMFQTALCRILQPFLELWTKVLSVLTSALMFWLQGFEMNHPKKPEKRIRVLFALTMMKLDYKEAESVYGFFHTWNGCRGCVWCMSQLFAGYNLFCQELCSGLGFFSLCLTALT